MLLKIHHSGFHCVLNVESELNMALRGLIDRFFLVNVRKGVVLIRAYLWMIEDDGIYVKWRRCLMRLMAVGNDTLGPVCSLSQTKFILCWVVPQDLHDFVILVLSKGFACSYS
ncbi:hypothetical protein [Sphingobacterium sp. JB170]|uniref:hypothetical protein n=1 Tax=Sphingobacterium sp. JB170 TaxID=1434842 RepID=UPI00117A914E|nr:hypothetical protein [Sphingobacterium sp. JB170]